MNIFLEATVLWSRDDELGTKNAYDHIGAQFSGIPPIHDHRGLLQLSDSKIWIEGDTSLIINLSAIEEVYRGFDDLYKPGFIKNFGLFCLPVRITYTEKLGSHTIYLIVGYNFFGCAAGQTLFNTLRKMLDDQ